MPLTLILVALSLSLSCHGTEGGRKFSNELRRQPIVQLEDADEFDCVDIYKQPAFDHILLKNHKLQMNPSSMPESKSKVNSQSLFRKLEGEVKGCPPGKVPIPRAQLSHNLTELRSLAKLHLGSAANANPLSTEHPGSHFAAYYYQEELSIGIKSEINLQNPPVKMHQLSMAQMWLENGSPGDLNSIQVGWAVHPRIYGDNRTRATAYWTADASKKTGCYNTMCPGFVQVHPKFHFGQVFPSSVPGGQQYITTPYVFQDQETHNWWAVFENDIKIGYWPKEIFTSLNQGATRVQFGGWTYNSPDGQSPPMGSGHFPNNNLKQSCFIAKIQYMSHQDKELVDIDGNFLVKFADNTKCFDAIFWGNQGGILKNTITFGGPGGMCGI